MPILIIRWQRLVDADGATCPRCQATRDALQHAVARLDAALRPQGIQPRLEISELDATRFAAAPAESNRIWIAGQPLEHWLDARAGSSPCCAQCGPAACRTLEIGATSFDSVPEELLVRAGLRAAADLLAREPGAPPAPAAG
ncbi:DUF2703 domain-containing protein [Pseudomonas oryzae]|uniref:Uncharacterized protein n=1 Tax=Pseudomonas oryzae TaxID=1392877 RepID=A0A1H1YS02_9PSED|nr:DUF2703 domain-containing protein [Pseudomonas oryzae]SDT24140.1 protein of unknown function [Pseudomonas oryzae]